MASRRSISSWVQVGMPWTRWAMAATVKLARRRIMDRGSGAALSVGNAVRSGATGDVGGPGGGGARLAAQGCVGRRVRYG
jgi:hypothetical protein